MEHDRETGGREGTEDFLTLAEAVTEERGRRAVGDGLLTKRDDLRDDCGLRRHDVTREAKRRFHDQGVRAWSGARLRREAGAQLEVARVEERAMLGGGEMDLRGTENVTGGVEGGSHAELEFVGTAEREFVDQALAGDARVEETGGGGRAEDLGMARHMVGVSVRDEGAGDAGLGIEGPADLREVDAFAENNLPRISHQWKRTMPSTRLATRSAATTYQYHAMPARSVGRRD